MFDVTANDAPVLLADPFTVARVVSSVRNYCSVFDGGLTLVSDGEVIEKGVVVCCLP
jgi:hypothetical protein